MSFLDILLGGLLGYGLYKGIKNGLFVEIASLLSLIVGIYIALKFSEVFKSIVGGIFNWNPKTIAFMSFIFTFAAVVLAISLFSKLLTSIVDFAHLGIINNLAGGFFRVVKTVLIVSIFLNLFEKINYNNFLAEKQTLDNSLFFRPIQKTAGYIYPSLEKIYDDFKKK